MTYEAEKIGKVKGLGDIYQAIAPLNRQLEAFVRVGINSLASPDEIAQVRLAGVSNECSRTNIAPIAIKGGRTILMRNSPLMNPLMASLAVRAHQSGNYFEMPKVAYEEAEAIANIDSSLAPEDRRAIVLSKEGDFDLTSKMPEAQFILRKQTAPYFIKFTNGKIPFYGISALSKEFAVINYLWFNSPQYGSGLNCWEGLGLGGDYGDLGVLKIGGASAKNLGYTLTEVKNANSENVHSVLGGTPSLEKALGDMLTRGLLEKLRGY